MRNNIITKYCVVFLISLPLLFLCTIISNAQSENDCFDLTNKRAIKFYDKAIKEYKRRNYLEANRLMKSVLDIEPECVDAYYVLAMINVKKIKYNVIAAKKYFLKVIELCQDYDIDAYYWLGSISYGAEKWY